MALKPTIYKFSINLSDFNHDYYDHLALTLAQHPSETLERMMVRVLAFCLNAHLSSQGTLSFTKGLSTVDEPDVWLKTLDEQLLLWLDVGEPTVDRIKKATRLSKQTKVYSFNTKSPVWWSQNKEKFCALDIQAYQFSWQEVQALIGLVERTMEFAITISDDTVSVVTAAGECTVSCVALTY